MKKIVIVFAVSILLFGIIEAEELAVDIQSSEINVDKNMDTTFFDDDISPNEVYIYRDFYGVPHIYGGSNRAMFFGEGYAHAEDHLEQMLENYRTVQGTMAEIFGSDYLSSDREMRLLRVAHIADEKYNELSAEAREAVETFSQGINYYMENNPEDVPEWATPVTPQEGDSGMDEGNSPLATSGAA
jgi:acyl-homoserine lactone acylase PvdQ